MIYGIADSDIKSHSFGILMFQIDSSEFSLFGCTVDNHTKNTNMGWFIYSDTYQILKQYKLRIRKQQFVKAL